MKKNDKILLGHGSGGRLSHELIRDLFVKHFSNPTLIKQSDAALLQLGSTHVAMTTDAFVVDPLFFPGGNIGNLAIAGTVNDLSVSGAIPRYLSASFIIEEGLPFEALEQVVITMAEEARKASVEIVTGDTKVVDRGKCDKLFINTTGIGEIRAGAGNIASGDLIKAGDKILVNGFIGDHGMAVMSARNQLHIKAPVESDCACLNGLIDHVFNATGEVHFMRDATRGGVGTVMAEIVASRPWGIQLFEAEIPIRQAVRGICELLGFDPLYVANEGKVVMVVDGAFADKVLQQLKSHPLGQDAAIIGEVVERHPGKTWLQTSIGGNRIVDMPAGEQLPRIC
ncbi:MAG: hydrogenase expression/formation protein HypE [Bacteroidetes bacterium]|nr:hydrogenase expression/formation protein HypE [Bacteroidales bacterium]MBU1008802.1 hydrogenase expression/formation protein HypE [Bacteroidota bacterium]